MEKRILTLCVITALLLQLFGCEKAQPQSEAEASETVVSETNIIDAPDDAYAITWPRYGLIRDYLLNHDHIKSGLYHLVYQESEYSDLIEIKEVTVNGSVSIVGEWHNKLYLNDGESIFYYDLAENPLKSHKWIVPPTKEEYYEYDKQKYGWTSFLENPSANTLAFTNDSLNFQKLGAPYGCSFNKAVLVEDIMYFGYTMDGLLFSINLNDSSIVDAKPISLYADFPWELDRKNGLLYYIEFDNSHNMEEWYSLWTYNVSTGEKQKINHAANFQINGDGTILWSTFMFENIYLHNIKTKEDILITDNAETRSNNFQSTAYYLDGNVYFYRGNQIFRWHDGETEVFYTVPAEFFDADDEVTLYAFKVYDENTICLSVPSVSNIWLVNGQIQTEPPQFEYDEVFSELLDGNVVTVALNDVDFPV